MHQQGCEEDKYKIAIKHNYLSRNFKFVLNISTASRSLLQQTEVTDVSHDHWSCDTSWSRTGEEDCEMQSKYSEQTSSFLRGNYA